MNVRIQRVLDTVVETLSAWDGVDTLTLMDFEKDIYDPYFVLSIDVYYLETLPDDEQRAASFSFAGGFETAGINRKDRFLIGDVPVRLEYKEMSRFEEIIGNSRDNAVFIRDSGTYMFYRLMESSVLVKKSSWLKASRSKLNSLGNGFWAAVRKSAQARMEHYLRDISAAVLREDDLFFLVSSGGFVKSACGALFAINKKFEPSPRQLLEVSTKLKVLPDVFQGLLESFIRHSDTSLSRKREVAQLLAKKIIQL